MRCTHTLHAATLLIDQNWSIAPHGFAQVRRQFAQLFWRVDIAGKNDESERIRIPKKRLFPITYGYTFTPQYRGIQRHLAHHNRDTIDVFGDHRGTETAGVIDLGKTFGAQTVECFTT